MLLNPKYVTILSNKRKKLLPPISGTYKYVHNLKTEETQLGYILKTANARELISKLPSPTNIKRNINLIPDIPIGFLLSTTEKLPEHISEQIENSENRKNFTNKSLLGLCTSGRGMPVKIFLHDYYMAARDPSGELFEEVAWHETVHGIEGIEMNDDGVYKRHMPWSYNLQQRMLSIDIDNNHQPDLPDDPKARAYIKYLREGTSLQKNVSEIFTRVAGIFMYEIKDTGKALTSKQDLLDLISKYENAPQHSRKERNIADFLKAWKTFSDDAQQLFMEESDNLIKRVATLYGCDTPKRY